MSDSTLFRLKQAVVGTALGRFVERARDNLALWQIARRAPEQGSRYFQHRCGELLLSSLCEAGRVFVDAGAHIGSVTAKVLRGSPGVTVVAIEAVPAKAAWLKRKYPGIVVHACALGAEAGEVEFQVDARRPGFSSLASKARKGSPAKNLRVPMRTLDELCARDDVGVIKLDVEGMELGVLRGAASLAARCRPVVYFESGAGKSAFGFTDEDLFDWFDARRFRILVPNRVAHEAPPLGRASFLEAHYYPQRTFNYFAIPEERLHAVRERARRILGVRAPR